jgi:hypothetical protein
VDRHSVAVAALHALGDERAGEALKRYGIDPALDAPWNR